MGDYTGLRGKIKIKKEMHDKINNLVHAQATDWGDILPSENVFLADWRNMFIPYGAICYMPDDWNGSVEYNNGILYFSCSLKNYNNTIEKFIEHVLPLIGDEWDLESLFECDDIPTKYQYK